MQGIPRALLFGATVSLVAADALAQGVIRGTVVDSLRGGVEVADAEVVLRGAGQRVRTDARGRFEFRDLPAGEHTLAFHARWLDSLGLPALERTVRIPASGAVVHVALATPPRERFEQALCGAPLAQGQGVLLGDVVGAPDGRPLGGLSISARWTETHLGPQRLDRFLVATVDTTTASGQFVLCGVPTDAEVALRAGDAMLGTEELLVGMDGANVRRRDLVVAAAEPALRVSGRVVGPTGTPLAGVSVLAAGDSSRRAVSDAEGRFTLVGLARRSSQLLLRAVGHEPAVVDLDPHSEALEVPEVSLRRAARELAMVTVTGAPMSVRRLEFEERRKFNPGGRFLTDEDLAKLPVVTLNAVVERVARSSTDGGFFRLEFNGEPCHPLIFVDGLRAGRSFDSEMRFRGIYPEEQARWLQLAKRIEVYRAAFAPPQFNDFEGCGALVIWTR